MQDLKLEASKYSLLPVNDSPTVVLPGGSGSHWSLLLYLNEEKRFLSFHSAGSLNYKHALKIANSLQKYFKWSNEMNVSSVPVPRQLNTHDCGIYLLHFIDLIVQLILQNEPVDDWSAFLPEIF